MLRALTLVLIKVLYARARRGTGIIARRLQCRERLFKINGNWDRVIQHSGFSHVCAIRVYSPENLNYHDRVGNPLIMSLKLAITLLLRLNTMIGNDQGEWPPDEVKL
jgi:hypothetical protein